METPTVYDPKELILQPLPDDLCPCGSGHQFKHCCKIMRDNSAKGMWYSDRKLDMLQSFYAELDCAIQNHPAPPCKQGCSECCTTQLFPIDPVEFELIRRRAIYTWRFKIQRQLHRRTRHLATNLAYNHPDLWTKFIMLIMHELSFEQQLQLMDDMGRVHDSPCPLLRADHSCSVYHLRPYICRKYGVSYINCGPVCSRISSERQVWQLDLEDPANKRLRFVNCDILLPDGVDTAILQQDNSVVMALCQPIIIHLLRDYYDTAYESMFRPIIHDINRRRHYPHVQQLEV